MKSEAVIQQEIRLAAPTHGATLWRNNNGACQSVDGRLIRYGLANDSQRMNEKFKSSDLIGITKRVITPEDVGKIIGIFTSVEVKRGGWVYTGTKREKAQAAWLQLIREHGGIAGFATGVGDIWPGV